MVAAVAALVGDELGPAVSKRSRVAMPGMPEAFQAFSTPCAFVGESQMASTVGPAPERHAPAAPRS